MPPKTHDSDAHRIPESATTTSSPSMLTPIVKDGVGEIAKMLVDVEGIIEGLAIGSSTGIACSPDIGGLFQEIAKLRGDVENTRATQDTQVRKLKDKVNQDVKNEITVALKNEISVIVRGSVAACVKQEISEWGKEHGATNLVSGLKGVVEANNLLLEGVRMHMHNSHSRRANSLIDVQDGLDTALKPIKREDGGVNELFPASLRVLFSYDATQLARLLQEHDLRPFKEDNENLNRFLAFIGVSVSIPDQFAGFSEEQPPAYPLGNIVGVQDEETQGPARRDSSASGSEQGTNTPWSNLYNG